MFLLCCDFGQAPSNPTDGILFGAPCGRPSTKNGLHLLTLETTIVMKWKRGPFAGAVFLGSVSECTNIYFRVTDHNDMIFEYFYRDIAREFGPLPADFGSECHKRMIWEQMQRAPILTNVGACVKMARWFSWFQTCRSHLLCSSPASWASSAVGGKILVRCCWLPKPVSPLRKARTSTTALCLRGRTANA